MHREVFVRATSDKHLVPLRRHAAAELGDLGLHELAERGDHPADVHLGFGRIVGSEKEVPNIFASLV